MSRLPHLSLTPIIIGIALLAGAYLALTTGRYVVHNYQLGQDEQALRAELQQIDQDHDQLTAVRDYLKSDEYIEYMARRILGLVRPGQTLVIVSGAETPPTPPPAGGTPAAEWWKDLFSQTQPLAPTPIVP